MSKRTYSELSMIHDYTERFRYLRLEGTVGLDVFGFDRYLNQIFYRSKEWRSARDYVLVRDYGCDLGVCGYEICGRAIVHHMNPLELDDILGRSDLLLNPEYLITVTHETHNAIHYGDEKLLVSSPITRKPNDTALWKKE